MSLSKPIKVDEMRKILRYDPESGCLYWAGDCHRPLFGKRAGRLSKDGYVIVQYRGEEFTGHRLAWALAHGDPGHYLLDHINGDRSDNRLSNLRLADFAMNAQNNKKARAGKPLGVIYHRLSGKWIAKRPKLYNGKRYQKSVYIGLFGTQEEAVKALMNSAKE